MSTTLNTDARSIQPSESPSSSSPDSTADQIFLVVLFVATVVANLILVTRSWHSGFLIGHEFRQSQTAIISYYIDQQNNFSLHYDTPILGKPWEAPLELPLYQWGVVLLSRLTHWPHYESARAVGVTALYLTLPALYLLLGRAGLPPRRRLIAFALLLATPVYIFYSRAFLMDVTAMMFAAWFLAGFVEAMNTRKLGWLLVCAVAGSAAGLIKSVILFVWLIPAALYGAWCLWRAWRDGRRWQAIAQVVTWAAGAVIVPLGLVYWWIQFTDRVKEHHASAYIFTSKNLSVGNFGTYSLSARLSKATWSALFDCWSMAIAKPWIVGLVIVAGALFFRKERWRVLGAFGLFLAAQLTFPYAYAYQDYYFTACTVFAVCAFGFALNGVFGSALSRWIRWPLMLAPFAGMYLSYANNYWQQQKWVSPGGTGLTIALRDLLPRDSVIIVAGADWSAIIPYYSKHRALMIRNGLEVDRAYVERAFNDLAGEDVAALVLLNIQRTNSLLIRQARKQFNIDSQPAFTWHDADVYVSNFYRDDVLNRLQHPPVPEGVEVSANVLPYEQRGRSIVDVAPAQAASLFKMFHPAPVKASFRYGFDHWYLDGAAVLNAHPDSDVWVPVPPGAKEVACEFGMMPGSYEGKEKTQGAEFSIDLEDATGRARSVYVRSLDPVARPQDRGTIKVKVPIDPKPGEQLVFRTRPDGGYGFDWCYWAKVDVH